MHRLFHASLTASLLISAAASAQGIELVGDARLGLGYNIDNDGYATGEDKLRAISRVRFGVEMSGETASGIAFGAEIRADNAEGGEGGEVGQFEGEVQVSGDFGTLSFGDTDGADYHHVGDLNEVGLTCLGCENETPFISNGGGFGNDGDLEFADNPVARPTIRYDLDFENFGFSLSSNRDLTDIGVGASGTLEFGSASITLGGGYYNYAEFTTVIEGEPVTTEIDGQTVIIPAAAVDARVPAGEQWSATVSGEFEAFNATVIYTNADSDGEAAFSTLGAGLGAEFGLWAVNFYYNSIIEATGTIDSFDGLDSTGIGVNYDLGGNALLQAGIAETFADETVSDFGISLAF